MTEANSSAQPNPNASPARTPPAPTATAGATPERRAAARRLAGPPLLWKNLPGATGGYVTDWIDDQGFRANVGIVLMRDDGQVFLGGRTGGRGWQFPQGGIRRGESVEQALYRELEEEVGLGASDVAVLGQTADWIRYRLPRQYVRRNATPLCIGQKQRWFLLRFRGREADVRFDRTLEPPEFDRWRWAEYWDPVREVIYFKRDVYRRALHELGTAAFPAGLPPYPDWWHTATDEPPARTRA